ncbi:MAG: hypothetical protein K6C38_06375 [Saccharofermentans sp.]|nr:hypothetical protein [Saccharofermentans sp.]
MDKKIDAARLLRAMSDVDDKYIEEAMETAAPAKRATVTSLRRYSGIIGIVAAAAILILVGGTIMNYMGRSKSASEEIQAHNQSIEGVVAEIDSATDDNSQGAVSGGSGECAGAPTTAAEPEVEDAYLYSRDSLTCEYMCFAFESLDALEESAQFDFEAPDSVDGSSDCHYFNYVYDDGFNIAEIQYLDEDGNLICTIRKAQGERNISDCDTCYSIERRVDVEDVGTVNLSGSLNGYEVAYWIHGGYSYSVTTEQLLTEDAILDLVSQVS